MKERTMDISSDQARLSQEKTLESLRREPKATEMETVYRSDRGGHFHRGIYCALIPSDQIERALSKSSWDLSHGSGVPGTVEKLVLGEWKPEYLRYGEDSGVEPLVIDREFHGIRDDYKEISEEFRLFHNLYHDRRSDEYLKIDDAGNEARVAVVKPGLIQIRLKEIRQFLAVKEMHLSIQFDCTERSAHRLEGLEIEKGGVEQRDGLMVWRHYCGDFPGSGSYKSFSRLWGKRLVEPLPKSKSGFWGFAEKPEEKHVEFIIDVDENGEEVAYTCNPDALANFFGTNPDAPNFLTPVHFRKQVLDKYFQQPSKYSVGDSLVCCGDLWALDIDNHHEDRVCVWLGRLGEGLPFQEQLHWRSSNIPPEGGMSEIYLRRQLMVQAMESDQPDLLFKEQYDELQKVCRKHLGWPLLQPLHTDDRHHIESLRIPSTDEQREFDELVLGLAKILIDSLHVKRLNSLLAEEQKEGVGEGGIARLEAVLVSRGVEGAAEHIAFLRNLQSLRSSSAAHRKGSKYKIIAKRFNIEGQSRRDVFAGILWQALDVLNYLILLVQSGRVENAEGNSIEEMYAILGELVGFVDAGATDGSINHDDLIYELRSKP